MRRRGRQIAPRLAGLAVVVAVAAGCEFGGETGSPPAKPVGASPPDVPVADCADGGASPAVPDPGDLVVGPLVLMSVRHTIGRRPDAFSGHGYKVPVALARGMSARLSVPRRWRARVGFVFTLATQERAVRLGVRGADSAIRFEACAVAEAAETRTGWAGGFVVDRPRCATVLLRVDAQPAVRVRVPLGRRC